MISDLDGFETVERLKDYLDYKYGKELKILHLLELSKTDGPSTQERLVGGDLQIPISKDGVVLGTAVLSEATDLPEEDRRSVASMVRVILDFPMSNWYIRQQKSNSYGGEDAMGSYRDIPGKQFGKNFLLIQGADPMRVERIASIGHEASGRWAKVSFRDVADSVVAGPESVAELGGISVYVSDLFALSSEERRCLTEYLESTHELDDDERSNVPFFIIGCSENIELMSQHGMLDAASAKLMRGSQFKVEQFPAEFAKLKQTFEILFEPAHRV